MAQYIPKSVLLAEIKRILSVFENSDAPVDRLRASILIRLLSFIDTLEVVDPYEQCIQYASIESGNNQAKKDLALTWKDIEKVCLIAREVHQFRGFWSESVYQEILERFLESKRV